MIVRCKMKCTSERKRENGWVEYEFHAVLDKDNESWSRFTPSATFSITVDRAVSRAAWDVGATYFFDSHPVVPIASGA
jgi:hypothetical protein